MISLARRIVSDRSRIFSVFLVAFLVRILFAPISAFDDIGAFHHHAILFIRHGLDFYLYAGEAAGAFAWPYTYPPLWAMILAIAYSGSSHFFTMPDYGFDPAWRVAEKLPIIIADMLVGYLAQVVWREARSSRSGFVAIQLHGDLHLKHLWSI